jgi:murein DD-endopeptidase MepM/ murein hydrolase activator NlpD
MAGLKALFKALVPLVLAGAVLGFAVLTLRTGSLPSVELVTSARAIGPRTDVVARVATSGRGLASLRLELEQKGRVRVVARREHRPLPPWRFTGGPVLRDELRADVGHQALSDLVEGEATVRVVAERASTWLLAPAPAVRELRLPVRLTPPSLSVLSTQHYVAQGGSGLVVYRVGPTAVADFVSAGAWRFPGWPLPGGASGDRVALFGVPWDLADQGALRVVAEDDAGNTAAAAFVDHFERRPPARDRITLDDAFLTKVVTEIREHTPEAGARGSLLADYLAINRELRAANASELVTLAERSAPSFLFSEPFLPLRNAKVMSAFADQRTYVYAGREVDQQTHLGFDLAAVARTPVLAPNPGVVRLARYFGIYGNSVVVDHGLGLMTLSAHLSSIEVNEGQSIERGEPIGRTGATGLAGGDHLHFTTLVRGLPVNPIEWWDGAWIRDRITAKMRLDSSRAQNPGARPR